MRRPALLVASALTLASVSLGCERREPSADPATEPSSEPTTEERRPAPPTPTERQEPEAAPLPASRDVEIETIDHVLIGATLYPAPDANAPAVVLVHELGATRAQWAMVIEALRVAPALTVLAIDLRGHGASTQRLAGSAVSYGDFDAEAWSATANDVVAAVEWLRSPDGPVHPSRVAVVGSSIGATAVVRAAANDRTLDVIATLSPGRAYRGVDSILVAVDLGPRAYLGVASREETDSVETAEALARITHGRTEFVDGSAHGLAMLGEHGDITEHLVSFLRESFAAPAAVAPVAAPPEEVAPTAAPQ